MKPSMLDGLAVLRAIAAHPTAFDAIALRASDLAQQLVVRQIKAKNASLASVKAVFDAIGAEAFALVLDDMNEADLKTLAMRLDPRHPDARTGAADGRRRRILALLQGKVEPQAAPAKTVNKAKAPAASKAPRKAAGHNAKSAQTRLGDKI